MNYLILFCVGFAAALIQGATGFGFSIVAMPLLSLVFPVRTIVPVGMLLLLGFTTQLAIRLRKHIDMKLVAVPLIASLGGRGLGVFLLMNLEIGYFRFAWGLVLLAFAVYFLFFRERLTIKPGMITGLSAGFLSGLMGGMYNAGGPPLVLYYFACAPDKRRYSAAMQVIFSLSNVFSLFMHFCYGNINLPVLKLAGVGMVVVLLGSLLGLRILARLERRHLAAAISFFTVVMGIVQIAKALIGAEA